MLSDKHGVENSGYESTVTGASCGEFEAWLCSERGRGCWVQVEQNNRGHFPNEYNKDRVSLTGPPQVRHPLCRFLKNITDGGRRRIKETADRKVFWGRREVTEETDWRRCEQTAAYMFVYRRRVMRQQKQRDRKKKSSLTSRLIYIYIYFLFLGCFSCFPPTKEKHTTGVSLLSSVSSHPLTPQPQKKIIGLKVAAREMWIFLLNHTNILRVRN